MNTSLFHSCHQQPVQPAARIAPASTSRAKCWFVRLALVLAAVLLSSLVAQAQSTWLGGDVTLPNDWNTAANWSGSTPPASAGNVLVGTATTVTSSTLDLGGSSTVNLTGTTPTAGSGIGLTNGNVAALHFGSAGGITSYTVQNGTVTMGTGDALVWLDDGITVDWNVSSSALTPGTQARFWQVGSNSVLNIGAGVTHNSRFCLFNGGASGSSATVNLNAANFNNNAYPWLVGSGNSSVSSGSRVSKNITLNVNANQTLPVGADIRVGYVFSGWKSKVVIRNAATLTTSGFVLLGEASGGAGQGILQVGDATTSGTNSISGTLALGSTQGSASGGGSAGVLDIINGVENLYNAGTVKLAYGALSNSVGIINVSTNGLLNTRANFALQTGATNGNGIMNFNGGMLQVDAGSTPAQRTNLIDASVVVNIQNGGMVFNCNTKTDSIINAGLASNGIGGLTVRDFTGSKGKLTLTSSNTYVGTTFLRDSATLILSNTASIASSKNIFVNGNASLNVEAVSGGFTVVSNQTLAGLGKVLGSVTVASGGIITPGSYAPSVPNLLGTLTFSNNLTLQAGAGMIVRLNTASSPAATNDALLVVGTQSIAGSTLTVTNIGPALTNGQSFYLFNQSAPGFTTVNLPAGYTWTNKLAIDGSIQVLSVVSATPSPTNLTYTVNSGQMVFSWPTGQGWVLQSNSVSLTDTNSWFDVTGATPPATNTIDASKTAVFFRLKY